MKRYGIQCCLYFFLCGLFTGTVLALPEVSEVSTSLEVICVTSLENTDVVDIRPVTTNPAPQFDFDTDAQVAALDVAAVPEPSSILLVGLGVLGLVGFVKRRIRK